MQTAKDDGLVQYTRTCMGHRCWSRMGLLQSASILSNITEELSMFKEEFTTIARSPRRKPGAV